MVVVTFRIPKHGLEQRLVFDEDSRSGKDVVGAEEQVLTFANTTKQTIGERL